MNSQHGGAAGPEPTCLPANPNPARPRLKLPPLACDSHFHVFGPARVFPFAEDRPFTPPDAPKEALFRLHKVLGFERGLIVQSSCHGTDHRALVDALAAGAPHYRGVALIAPSTPADEVARLDAASVCGVRFHFAPHLGESLPRDELRRIVRLVQPHGWHIAVHVIGNGLLDILDFVTAIEAPVVIDHIGRVDVRAGPDGEAFTALRRLIDRGNVWVKLSGADRVSREPMPFRDATALARILAEQAPERVLWGTDWPHPNVASMPDDGLLVDLIADIAVDEAIRHRMLVDNPAELFRFA